MTDRGQWILVVLLLGGCAKRSAAVALENLSTEHTLGAEEATRPPVTGPVHWWDVSGLCLDVPEGWVGEGQDAHERLLSLVHTDSGVVFEVLHGAPTAERTGYTRVFSDTGKYRDLPALQQISVESWVSTEPGGKSVQVWSGAVGDRIVTLEVHTPFGQVISQTGLTETLFRGICVE